MRHTVPIEGDPALAAGLLACAGIQSLASFNEPGHVAAVVRAESGDAAKARVADALGAGFKVGGASR